MLRFLTDMVDLVQLKLLKVHKTFLSQTMQVRTQIWINKLELKSWKRLILSTCVQENKFFGFQIMLLFKRNWTMPKCFMRNVGSKIPQKSYQLQQHLNMRTWHKALVEKYQLY